ncbi:MAG TPA: MtrB/PioB family outer membrane beta-barrel protein [Vicinamibacterales bacterium]|nr:MtrB/PioB family outer membrane beta-barrel protein [Vicinamibacterales bacterium]
MRTRHVLTAVFLLGFASAALAQDPPSLPALTDPVAIGRSETSGRWYGTVDFGARASTVDGDAARFQRYRDLRSGIYANAAVAGRRTQDWTFEAQAWNIGYRDQRYQLDVQRVGRLTGTFLWDQIPLFISGDTRTLYTETQPGVFRLEDSMQQAIQAGQATLHAYEDQAVRFDLRTMRKIGQADVMFNATPSSDLMLHFKSTTRDGAIPFGGTFGFSNAVEIPAPVTFRTTDFKTAYEWANAKALLRVGWDGSAFNNDLESVVWENPLRFGPDAAGAPSQGRLASWPDNTLNYLHGTGTVALPMRGRLTGYLAVGQATSNADLLPFTINTAIAPPPLARPTAEAESQMTIANFTFAMRPASIFSLNARYRYSDVNVDTPIFDRSLGSVSYDTNLQSSADASRYHSVTRSTFDADGAFDLGRYTQLKVGYSNLGSDYTHRIWESTTENVFRVSADVTGNPLFGVRALYENRERTGDDFQAEELTHVGELPGMRHYDIADRSRDRLTLILNAIPNGAFGLTGSIGVGSDEYTASDHGLQFYDSEQYSIGFSFAPDDRYNAFASWGWENYQSQQRSRNASSTAEQANPARDWTTDYTGKVKFFEGSLDINNVIDRTMIRLTGDWNKSNDTYLYGLVTGSPLAVPEQLPPVKNELFRAEVDVSYELAANLRLGVAYWFDDYNVEDFALGPDTISGISFPPVQEGQQAPTTNALLLGYTYRPYTAHVGFVRLTYAW